ncbi:MAG: M23 family metallopeptidase [Saprospiraceae bacterium]|nr:M23 family metallopeptidase [Saprospiraceae bacterium]
MRLLFLLIIATIFFLSFSTFESNKKYPQGYFRSPVSGTIRLSGTFGELRPNHLHAGIDIKAKDGKIGQALYSAADGYVSRIKMQSGGYGKVLYIDHPNGYTTVYAHMHEFDKSVEEYVKQKQKQKETFAVELFPKPNQFSFKKGNKIGKLGMSGRSYGPHLHFEIRDTKTEKPINPLLFGINVTDNIPPRIHQLKIYNLNDKRETQKTKTIDLLKNGKKYFVRKDTLTIGAWRVGLALKTYDNQNGASNWNGIYSLEMFQDGQPIYDFKMETFSFNETRYINAHLDYEEQVVKKSYFNRCYELPGNELSIYGIQSDAGIIPLSMGKASKIEMVIKDIAGNRSTLKFWIKRGEIKNLPSKVFNYILPYDEDNQIETGSLSLFLKKGTLYENLYLKYNTSIDESEGVFSTVHQIHDYKTPAHRYFDIGIKPSGIPENMREKAFIAYCGKSRSPQNCGGKWKDGKLTTKVRDFGNYCIMIDTKSPSIEPISFKSNMRGASRMTFKVKENFETARNIEPFTYKVTVDGKWILMDYDGKNDLLIHRFDGSIQKGKHLLRIEVTDDRGNEKIYEREFTR